MSAITITTITVDENFVTIFSEESFSRSERNQMLLTDQIGAVNLRLRESETTIPDWHVAGDPTLIVIQQGQVRIILQNGEYRDFGPGDLFIAKDYLPHSVAFNPQKHGHRAQLISKEPLKAVHIKLGYQPL